MQKWVIGIDEAGRGPLAGPVAVGAVMVAVDFDWGQIEGVGDSKQVAPKKREALFARAQVLKKEGKLEYAVVMTSAKIIDKVGIVPSITRSLDKALKKVTITLPKVAFGKVSVKLDGGLKAPAEYINQETIIKGDSKEKVIGLASIMAKVTRDHYMEKIAKKPDFILYNFAQHKGYGTKTHREAVIESGLSSEHRVSFCGNIKEK
jgi:ribonuclease HII